MSREEAEKITDEWELANLTDLAHEVGRLRSAIRERRRMLMDAARRREMAPEISSRSAFFETFKIYMSKFEQARPMFTDARIEDIEYSGTEIGPGPKWMRR